MQNVPPCLAGGWSDKILFSYIDIQDITKTNCTHISLGRRGVAFKSRHIQGREQAKTLHIPPKKCAHLLICFIAKNRKLRNRFPLIFEMAMIMHLPMIMDLLGLHLQILVLECGLLYT